MSMSPAADHWNRREVCVTGGTGFLGYHLCKILSELGAIVRVYALRPRPDHPVRALPNVRVIDGDILDAQAVRQAIDGCATVFHTAGIVSVFGIPDSKVMSVHVGGTQNVLDGLGPSARLVHTSSMVAVGWSRSRTPVTEDTPFSKTCA